MLKNILKPFVNPYIGPVLVISLIVIYLLVDVLPTLSHKNKLEHMKDRAVEIVDNLKKTRSYYTANVISDIKANSDLKINYDHQNKEDTIPLPATLVHDLSEIIAPVGVEIKMFSNYPFPNRKDRVLDEFEKTSLKEVINDPAKVYTSSIGEEDNKVFKVAVADIFYDPACVKCHNTRADTPKNDWELGDVRGIIEVSIPYKEGFFLSSKEMLAIMVILIVLILILKIHYTVLSVLRQKQNAKATEELEKQVEERTAKLEDANKLLNEYKRAVDISAIVSKTDKNGVITYVNEEFVKVSQYSQEELIGKKHSLVRHEDMPKEAFKDLWETIRAKKVWKGQIKNRAKDGSSYYVASTIVPIVNNSDEIEEFLAIRLDITDIIESQIKAKRADEAKSTFLANISHEIRTPLNAIIGFSDILSKANELTSISKKQAMTIQTSAVSLLTIINDILDVSKIESGTFDINIDKTDVYYVSEQVVELFSKKAAEKNIRLVFNLDHKIPLCIKTDGVRIRQVLSNLLSNAIKFTPAHGMVSFNISLLKKEGSKAAIRFEVFDSGIGIPEEELKTIFKPFIQVDHKTNREYQGTGLGLSICTHIIESLGAKIEVESTIGSGTRFWFDMDFDVCEEKDVSSKNYLNHIHFKTTETNSDVFHYLKRYLNILGTINDDAYEPEVIVCTCLSKNDENLSKIRQNYKDKPTLLVVEYEEQISEFELKDNEYILALPFYASKVNDAIQELLRKNSEGSSSKEEIVEKFNGKLLIAEDNHANQELISYILDSMEIEYDIKDNGLEAYNAYKKSTYDLVFMDINMPVLDGMEAFKKIREYEKENEKASTPVFALTANAIKGDKEKFLNLGMSGYLSKPINTNELKEVFRKYLKQEEQASLEKIETKDIESIDISFDIDKISSKLGISKNICLLIIEKFKKEISKDMLELKELIDEDNELEYRKKAHYIKNSCLNVSLDEVCEILQKIETSKLSRSELFESFNTMDSMIKKLL